MMCESETAKLLSFFTFYRLNSVLNTSAVSLSLSHDCALHVSVTGRIGTDWGLA